MKAFIIIFSLLIISSCANIVSISKREQKRSVVKSTKNKNIKRVKRVKKYKNNKKSKSDQIFYRQSQHKLKLHFSKKSYTGWVKYFQSSSKKRFLRYMSRGERYKTQIQAIFRAHGLPEDLYYVGLIESGYHLKARSHASAVGPWQFMKKTGIHYGLKVNSRVDERLDIKKSTHAAAKYFKDLYNIFGSWELALCGYNAGEYGMIRAIRKGNTRNYIQLSHKGLIPKETSNYVPKVAAARYVYARFLKQLGKKSLRKMRSRNFKPLRAKKKYISKTHKVRKGDTLYSISRKHGTSIIKLKKMNKISGSHIMIGQKIRLAYYRRPSK